eukprot:gene13763-15203_t
MDAVDRKKRKAEEDKDKHRSYEKKKSRDYDYFSTSSMSSDSDTESEPSKHKLTERKFKKKKKSVKNKKFKHGDSSDEGQERHKKKKTKKSSKHKKNHKKLKKSKKEKLDIELSPRISCSKEKHDISASQQNPSPANNEANHIKQPKKRPMIPMTKEEYEKQQSVIRRVYDPDTGRNRLIKGDGEVIEEIVSHSRQREINKQATRGDAANFQRMMGLS